MNKCILIGNFTKNTDYNDNGSVKVARNSMALNRGKDRDGNDLGADFVNIVAFGNKADFMKNYCIKGRKMAIESHVKTGSYEKDGVKRYTTDFIVDSFEFVDSKPIESVSDIPSNDVPDIASFMSIPDGFGEELPFN